MHDGDKQFCCNLRLLGFGRNVVTVASSSTLTCTHLTFGTFPLLYRRFRASCCLCSRILRMSHLPRQFLYLTPSENEEIICSYFLILFSSASLLLCRFRYALSDMSSVYALRACFIFTLQLLTFLHFGTTNITRIYQEKVIYFQLFVILLLGISTCQLHVM